MRPIIIFPEVWRRHIVKRLNINDVIDSSTINKFHWSIIWLCALLLIFDGYDLFIYGVVLPVLMDEWGLSPVQAGALGSYALFGMMLDRKSTRLNSSHVATSYAVFCLKNKIRHRRPSDVDG